jgi:uroporphyrinogen-III synthase
MSLSGKTFLVTRAAQQADNLVHLIEQHGGKAIAFPTIEITPPDSWQPVDKTIESLHMYDGLIFTSANGVEFFFQRMNVHEVPLDDVKNKLLFSVGEKTKQTLEHLGLSVTAVPDKFTAQDLTKMLQQEDLKGKSFLFPRGNLGNDSLPETVKTLGAHVEAVTVYKTMKPKFENIQRIRSLILYGSVNVATFTSPSTFRNITTLFSRQDLKQFFSKTKIAVIGPVTAKAVEDAGYDVEIIPKISTVESLVETIVKHFDSQTSNP